MIKTFKIYYGDGSTYSGDPFYAPPNNVQVIVNDGAIQSGKTAYYWNPDNGWNGCDTFGLWDHLLMFVGPKAVLFGRTIRDDDFWETMKRAIKERDEAKMG
jgi:hypothetical protein